jgi:hypothetical protein
LPTNRDLVGAAYAAKPCPRSTPDPAAIPAKTLRIRSKRIAAEAAPTGIGFAAFTRCRRAHECSRSRSKARGATLRAMRAIALLPACLLAAATAATPPRALDPATPAAPAPAQAPTPAPARAYSPETQATLDWLGSIEAARARETALATPSPLAAPMVDPTPGIHRCAGPNGTAVFTDRSCESQGAVESAAPSAADVGTRIFVRSCARSREALLDGLRDALDAQDANRVASYYHWTGMGTREGYALMDRLQGFSAHPLVDVRLVSSVELARQEAPMDPARPWLDAWPPFAPVDPAKPPPRPPLDLIRVDQMKSYDDATAQVTYFHLQPNAGCWWVRF